MNTKATVCLCLLTLSTSWARIGENIDEVEKRYPGQRAVCRAADNPGLKYDVHYFWSSNLNLIIIFKDGKSVRESAGRCGVRMTKEEAVALRDALAGTNEWYSFSPAPCSEEEICVGWTNRTMRAIFSKGNSPRCTNDGVAVFTREVDDMYWHPPAPPRER